MREQAQTQNGVSRIEWPLSGVSFFFWKIKYSFLCLSPYFERVCVRRWLPLDATFTSQLICLWLPEIKIKFLFTSKGESVVLLPSNKRTFFYQKATKNDRKKKTTQKYFH